MIGTGRQVRWLLAALLPSSTWALVLAPQPASGSGTTITVRPWTTPLSVYELSGVESPPAGESHASTTLSAVVGGCPPGGEYFREMSLVQDGHAAQWAVHGGLGASDWNCDDGEPVMTMPCYNPDRPIHPGRATVSVTLVDRFTGELVATATRTVTIPRSAPTAPTKVSAATTSATSARLAWSPPVTCYRVSRTGGAGWSTTISGTARSFRFDQLVPGTRYTFSVRAINALGSSPAASATLIAGAPGTASGVTARATSSTTARLAWAPPATRGASTITGYRVTRSGGLLAEGVGWSTTLPATARSWSFGRLAQDYYTFSVAAINRRGTGTPGAVTIHVPTISWY